MNPVAVFAAVGLALAALVYAFDFQERPEDCVVYAPAKTRPVCIP